MLTTLPESRAPRARRTGGTVLSILVHGALIAGATALTMAGPVTAPPEPPGVEIIFHPTAEPVARTTSSSAADAHVHSPVLSVHPPTGIPDHLPPIEIGATTPADITIGGDHDERGVFAHGVENPGPGLAGPGPVGGVVDEHIVDRAPFLVGSQPAPWYPSALRANGMSGRVLVKFVVDTLGRAEVPSIDVTESSHVLFAEAVREALARYRFSPGEVGGRKVRTMVQLPFNFQVR